MKGIGFVYQMMVSWFSNGLKTIMLRKSLFWVLSIIFLLETRKPAVFGRLPFEVPGGLEPPSPVLQTDP